MEERKVRIVTYGVVLVGILIVFCVLLQHPRLDGRTHVYMLNVGQGDSFLIQAANGRQMLIDGGRDATVLSELAKVMPRGDRSIDVESSIGFDQRTVGANTASHAGQTQAREQIQPLGSQAGSRFGGWQGFRSRYRLCG